MNVTALQSCKPHVFFLNKANCCLIYLICWGSMGNLGFENNGFIALNKKDLEARDLNDLQVCPTLFLTFGDYIEAQQWGS